MCEKPHRMNLSGRLASLDAFRGVSVVILIFLANAGGLPEFYSPLRHADWHGWTFTDLWFPFFIFIVGAAIPFSFARRMEMGYSRHRIFSRVVRRVLILFVLGLLINGFPTYDLSTIRIMGVLQRIALCYLFASAIHLTSKIRWQLVWAVGLLLLYWGLMALVPVPGIGAGSYEKGRNLAAYVDGLILRTEDPEGIVSTIPAISTALFGVLAGCWLRSNRNAVEKTLWLFIGGNLGVFLAVLWDALLPINKNLWTSSFVVLTAGFALVFLGFCYYFIDVKGHRKWAQPFIVFGTNALTVYILVAAVYKITVDYTITLADGTLTTLQAYIYERCFAWLGSVYGWFSYAVAHVLLLYFFVWILYKKRIFIRA